MTGSRRGRKEKRNLPDGEINVAAITPDAQRTRKDGGARVPAGYLALCYEHHDGTVEVYKQAYRISLEHFENCRDMVNVARVVNEIFGGLEHLKPTELRFCKGEQPDLDLEEFLEEFRGSNRTSPVNIFCRAPVGPVPDVAPWKRHLDERYREFAPSSMDAKNVRRVQNPRGSELGPLYKCGRPVDAAGLEAPLMHPAFGSFVQNLRNSSLPTREDYAFVREFCETSSLFYKNEHERQTALMPLLNSYLKRPVGPKEINKFEVDGYIGRDTGFPVYSIIEVENELGSTNVDKFFQGQRYYAEFYHTARANNDSSAIFTSCNCPAFLVEFRGVQMRISAMAYFDRVHTSMLTDLVNISWPSDNLPHIFKSWKVGIDSLESFYEGVEQRRMTSTRGNWLEKEVPYPVWWNPRYTFKSSDFDKRMFLAEDNQKRMLVIKFSRRYGDEVHRAWHSAGFAPELVDVEELAGGFKMIAMEYLGPPWQMLVQLDTETKERARVVVREALQEVHKLRVFDSSNAGSVHGDVRDVNIMVRSHGTGFDVRFVDFDWAGQESVSTYPPNMNHTTIAWPEGVADGEPMLQTHDMKVFSSTPGLASDYDWRSHV